MLTPAYTTFFPYFFPIGNTPAICLSQSIPRGKTAHALLLGCGDVRNILFTRHVDDRELDITCCDVEEAIIARNILLLSLIFDDRHGRANHENWDIYYHLYLDKSSYDRLRSQATKLRDLAASTETWENGEYGKHIKFYNHGTLESVRRVWSFYVSQTNDKNRSGFEDLFKAALGRRDKMKGEEECYVTLTAIRSVIPTVPAAIHDASKLYRHFRKHGTTDINSKTICFSRFSNPMLISPHSTAPTLHYGLDPLLGFHLAMAYVPLAAAPQSPPMVCGASKLQHIVSTARAEFNSWSDSFRKRAGAITLRVFVGEALHFAHALQCRRSTGGVESGNWYCTPRDMTPLSLCERDYGPGGSAPVSFNVIDTSNLMDHVGALNLLAATSPLLRSDLSATIYTDILVRQGKSRQQLADDMLCGHLPIVSLLLGLSPVEYWTNTAMTSTLDDNLMDAAGAGRSSGGRLGQVPGRIIWKRPISHRTGLPSAPSVQLLQFDGRELAGVLYGIYSSMMTGGRWAKRSETANPDDAADLLPEVYHRAGFASFLRVAKSLLSVDWTTVMEILLERIEDDAKLSLSRDYI